MQINEKTLSQGNERVHWSRGRDKGRGEGRGGAHFVDEIRILATIIPTINYKRNESLIRGRRRGH